MELRPLGFGEIFDRAVTLYIRNFIPFAAIVAVMIVPLAILQYIVDVASQPQLSLMWRFYTHLGSAQPPIAQMPTLFGSPGTVGALALLAMLTYLVWPFTLNAVAVGVARLYRNRPVEFRACYEAVLHRWLQILGTIGFALLVFIGCYIAFFVVVIASILLTGIFTLAGPVMGTFFGVLIVTVDVAGFIVSFALLLVVMTFAMYATVIEERPVIESVGLGFARVYNRTEFWRALLFAISVGAVILGSSAMFGAIGLVAAFAHLPLLQSAIESLTRAIVSPFAAVLLAVYYFDVRIRREAFDLETSLERLAATQPA
jgi:hypothetical protein